MGLYGGGAVPFSLYPADLVEGFFKNKNAGGGMLYTIIRMKIESYKEKHDGKAPARIFITLDAYMDISDQLQRAVITSSKPETTLFGIPVSLIAGDGAPIYLSDEEAYV